MSRRIRTTVLGIVALVAIGGIGITAGAFLSGGSSPAQTAAAPVIPSPSSLGSTSSTTSPTSDPTYDPVTPSNPMIIPDPATHALDRSEKAQPFGDNLTYSVPLTWSSRNWDGAVDYADMTNCTDTASCPHITFIDLTNPSSVTGVVAQPCGDFRRNHSRAATCPSWLGQASATRTLTSSSAGTRRGLLTRHRAHATHHER